MVDKKLLETSLVMPVTPEFIERRICIIRGQKVLLDSDLAELYQVQTKVLNQAVKRNRSRFPEDFMFQLVSLETAEFNRSQFVTGSRRHRNPRFQSYAFTELGVAMLSSVLNSERAVQMNIFIMRAFVKLRELMASYTKVAKKIEELENGQKEHRTSLILISTAVNKLIEANRPKKNAIGFIDR